MPRLPANTVKNASEARREGSCRNRDDREREVVGALSRAAERRQLLYPVSTSICRFSNLEGSAMFIDCEYCDHELDLDEAIMARMKDGSLAIVHRYCALKLATRGRTVQTVLR